jgi:hypothetical protein
VEPFRRLAAANNAAWCDVICRTHGLEPAIGLDAWTSAVRTPPYYPDAVTLAPDVVITGLLARVDATAGCSIKDSFATLDLAVVGFHVLFEAEWIVRPPTTAPLPAGVGPAWEVVRSPGLFAAWERAWRGEDGPAGVLRAELLGHESVTLLAARAGDRILAGAVLNRGAGAVGLTNVFAAPTSPPAYWAGCLALADALFPGSTLVGYETGRALDAARAHGFQTAGPLRVWSLEH